ncbi:MAG: alpha-1,2-fucosyltransferase [Geobacteraceae bacterium]|nr:alpha-1,2-fucosyltransferase [Geobacteraceae bacterium]
MICVRLIGGLGNQMFQYAVGRQLSLKYGTELIVDATYLNYIPNNNTHFVKRDYNLNIFEKKINVIDPLKMNWLPIYSNKSFQRMKHFAKKLFCLYKLVNGYRIILDHNCFQFDDRVMRSGKNAYLIGYWQNERYFRDIEEQIRRDFRLRIDASEIPSDLVYAIENCNSVCLHVRRGDFLSNPTHGFVGNDYFMRAIDYLKKRAKVDKIFVFSDDIDWCLANLKFDLEHAFVSSRNWKGKMATDLYLMTRCRHFIISNSTFGWWAAWLADTREKVVVSPQNWVNLAGVDASEILPQGWVSM